MKETSNQPSSSPWRSLRATGAFGSLAVAVIFCGAATCILMLRQEVIAFRPGQYVGHNLTSRVGFDFADPDQFARMRQRALEEEPNVYRAVSADYWAALQDELTTLPDQTYHRQPSELPADLQKLLDPGDLSALERIHDHDGAKYDQTVARYVAEIRRQLTIGRSPLVILPAQERQREFARSGPEDQTFIRYVTLYPAKYDPGAPPASAPAGLNDPQVERRVNVASETYSTNLPPEVVTRLLNLADPFPLALKPPISEITFNYLQKHPTHTLDLAATKAAQDRAAADVSIADATEHYPHDTVIVPSGILSDRDWQVLRAENEAYLASEAAGGVKQWVGTGLTVLMLTAVLGGYIWRYQPRVVRNRIRAVVLAALMLGMLLVSGLAGIGSGSLFFFGVVPTILTAIILTIAYDQRFASGVAIIEAVLVTSALNQAVGFFLILLVGVLVACYLLNDVRTRSKLIEVGGMCAIAMMAMTAATGMTSLEAMRYVTHNTMYAGAAGLAAGFVTLGILPFIERAFRITTSMTLLELADVTQPLLRQLAMDAPGTYNHSLQVATLASAAAEAIGANSLACRVGAYYHDVGKIKKADYFAENQIGCGPSRHLNLTPSVSLMIIIDHVKDGMELARQHNLPTTILQFIQQHHGTTLVEYFYHEACKQTAPDAAVPETQYRYPGPKPKSKETAILMLADCCESACRAMQQPDPNRMEALVHDLAMRRLHDGQFDECDLTLRDLSRIEQSICKMLLGIYHGRMSYPSTSEQTQASPARRLA